MSLNLDRLQAQDKYWEGGKPTLQMQLFWQKFAKAIEDAFNTNEALDATQQQLIEDVQTALTAALGASNDLGVTNDFIRTRDSAVSSLTLDADTSSITVSTHDRQYLDPSQTVSVTGDTITGLSSSTTYYVHYTDEDYSGGTVGYQVATALADAVPSPTEPYRHYVGTVEVPAVGTATGTAAPDPYWKVTSVGGGGGGTTTNAVTFDDTGGAAPGTTFDGSAAKTIDYSTVGAAALGHDHDSDYLALTGGTLTGDLNVPDEAYDATNWNGSTEVPTKNAIRDKFETLSSGGAWALAGAGQTATGVWDFAVDGAKANVDFTGLAGATDIRVVMHGATKAVTSFGFMYVSVNNGSSYFTTSGDYIFVGTDGTVTNTASMGQFHLTTATAARTGILEIRNANLAPAVGINVNVAVSHRLFLGSTSAINAVRVVPGGGGNFTGGKIYCFARF